MNMRILLCSLCAAVGIVSLTGCSQDPAPSAQDLRLCIMRIDRHEKNKFKKRKCVEITDIAEITPMKNLPTDLARFLKLSPKKEVKRYRCTIKWQGGTSSAGIFFRQEERFAILCDDWFGN